MYAAKDAGRDGYQPLPPRERDPSRELASPGACATPPGGTSSSCTTSRWSSLSRPSHRRRRGADPLERPRARAAGARPTFLPIAERTGLIRPITDWVLDGPAARAATWRDAAIDLFVSVNLPPAFWQPTAIRRVMSTIEAFGLNADRMMIEITEQAAMADIADLEPMLAEIHARGLRLAIDDFGTGHSSLGRLRRLRLSMIKIDRSFIADLPARPRGAAVLVETMITWPRSLGLQCLAEGIETEEQLAFLIAPRLPARPGLPVRQARCRRPNSRSTWTGSARRPRR